MTGTLVLNYPVNFVIPEQYLWEDMRFGHADQIDEQKLSQYAVGTRNAWVSRTYFHLSSLGVDVTHSPTPDRTAINVVAPRDFGRRDRHPDDFIIVPRCDSHRPMLANYTLTQCAAAPENTTTSYMPLWPQANIRARDHVTRQGISRLSFKGRLANLEPPFRSQAFIDQLSAMGVELALDDFDALQGQHDWGDYTDSDVVLAVRNLTQRDALHKPPSKLVNAWFGETPAILGPEPAFRSIRQSDLDYCEVFTPEDVIAVLRKLRETPALFEAMIENGRKRREAYTVTQRAAAWVDVINTRAGPLFDQWQRKSPITRRLVWSSMMVTEPMSKRYYRHYIGRGQRILDMET